MYCTTCGARVESLQSVCRNCGQKAGKGNTYCSRCGNSHFPDAASCLSCGASLQISKSHAVNTARSPQPGQIGGHSKMLVIVLCVLLGGLGVHNFILGENKKGFVKLLLSFLGISGLFALIDLIRLATDRYSVDADAYI